MSLEVPLREGEGLPLLRINYGSVFSYLNLLLALMIVSIILKLNVKRVVRLVGLLFLKVGHMFVRNQDLQRQEEWSPQQALRGIVFIQTFLLVQDKNDIEV